MANTLDRDDAAEVVAKTKLHTLDTIAAMVSGSRLKAGKMAARYVDSLGGKPQATVIGTRILTSSVNAALANGMAAHGDETDDSHLRGRFHPGCGIVPAALATAELAGPQRQRRAARGRARLRYRGAAHLRARLRQALHRAQQHPLRWRPPSGRPRRRPRCCGSIRRGVRHAFSFAAQQASGVPYWERDREHVEKAFDFGGMGARNGVTAATMIASGFTGVDDFLSGSQEFVHRDRRREAGAGRTDGRTRQALRDHEHVDQEMDGRLAAAIGARRRSTVLLEDPAVRAGKVKRIVVDMPADRLHIVDNRTISDICLQHLVAMMIVDGGATFDSIHDKARMSDPKVLAVRKLVEAVPNQELVTAVPARQSIVKIETTDGRTLSHRTYEVRGTPGNPMTADEVVRQGARPDGADPGRCPCERTHRGGYRARRLRSGVRAAAAVAGLASTSDAHRVNGPFGDDCGTLPPILAVKADIRDRQVHAKSRHCQLTPDWKHA